MQQTSRIIRSVLVEDEPDQAEGFMGLLKKYCPEVDLVGVANDVPSAIEAILESHPDLVFLDIKLMGQANAGFEVLNALHFMDFELVFLSSRTEYALQALNQERQVCYFLEKPVQIDKTVLAVKKAMEQIQLKSASKGIAVKQERLVVPKENGLEVLWLRDIVHCEADSWLTKVHIRGKTRILPVSKHLGWFCRSLPEDRFIRIHNSHLVNLDFVVDYISKDGGMLTLLSGEKIPVGPAYKPGLLKLLGQL